jgi:hypothetical protein
MARPKGDQQTNEKIRRAVQDRYDTDAAFRARQLAGLRRYHERRRKEAMELYREFEQAKKEITP